MDSVVRDKPARTTETLADLRALLFANKLVNETLFYIIAKHVVIRSGRVDMLTDLELHCPHMAIRVTQKLKSRSASFWSVFNICYTIPVWIIGQDYVRPVLNNAYMD